MKRVLLAAAAAAAFAGLAGQASAQTTLSGNVTVTGSVASKCTVVTGGPAAGPFSGTIALGALDATDGTLNTTLSGSVAASPAGSVSFRINCTKANAGVTLDADALVTAGAAATGYTNTVNYTADLVANLAAGGPDTFTNNTVNTATSGTISGALANAANNLTVKVYGLTTAPGALLVAGSYAGNVAVTIAPAA